MATPRKSARTPARPRDLAATLTADYRRKGYSAEEAAILGRATAAKVGSAPRRSPAPRAPARARKASGR